MKVLFDHQIFSLQNYGGISRYFYEIVTGLENAHEIEALTYPFYSNNHYISSPLGRKFKNKPFFNKTEFRGKQRMIKLINSFLCPFRAKKIDFELFHPTYYDPWFLSFLGKKPFVLTIYDMTHEKFSDFFANNDATAFNKKMLAQKAERIIAISENTKKDIVELYNIDPEKISVTHLACSFEADPCTAEMRLNGSKSPELDFSLPEQFILFTGSRSGYKNFENLARAASDILKKNRDLKLVCAGGGAFSANEKEFLQVLGIEKSVIQKDLTDKIMKACYSQALCFVFPSLYEGFGIPVLEAFSCCCPLLCSSGGSLPEVADQAAVFFDPNSVESIRDSIAKVIDSQSLRQNLIDKGKERLKNFSWKKTVEQTKEIYKSVI